MVRRGFGLALLGLALVLPSTSAAKSKQAADPPKVLVVTSTQDALTTAGLAAINAASAGDAFTVTAPAPAAVGAEFTAEKLETYRAVVFLNTGLASPLTDAQRGVFEAYFRKGGGVRRHRLGDRDRSLLAVPDRRPRHARVQPHRAADGHGEGLRPHPRRQQVAADDLGAQRPLLQPHRQRPRRLARARERRRGPVRSAAAGPDPGRHRGRHDGLAAPRVLLQGLPGRPLVLHRAGQHRRGLRRHADDAPQGRDLLGAPARRTPSTATAAPPSWRNFQQTKIGSPPNLQEPIGFDQLPDGRILQTDRLRLAAPAQRGHRHDARSSPTSTTRACRARSASTPRARTGSTARRSTRTSRPTSGCTSSTRRRRSSTSSSPRARSSRRPRPPPTRRTRRRRRPRGIRTSATTSSRASSSSRTRTAPRLDMTSEQQILKVPMNRQECCHVAGDIDFDKHGNMWLITGDDTPAGGINAGGYGPFNDQKTDEQQTVRVTNATGGTFTLTYNGQTTAPLAWNATAAQVDAALEALSNIGADDVQTSGGPVQTANVNVFFRRALQQSDQNQMSADGAALHGRHGRDRHLPAGRLVPAADRRLPPQRAQHQRPARQAAALQGQGGQHHGRRRQQGRPRLRHGRVHDPVRQPVPARRGRAAGQDPPGDPLDGLPQPVPRPGGRERRRLHQRLLAGRQRAAALTRPVGHRPLRDRAQAVQLRLAHVLQARPGLLQVELPRVRAQHHVRRARR